ncbi:MAG: sigma-70 family RNA polymerase sigma factor [bacterium]
MENNNSIPPGDSDLVILKACCRKEEQAWERFLDRFGKLIYYAIHRTLGLKNYHPAPEEVEDLFSEVLVHFIKDDCKKLRLYRGDEGCTVATWVRTVTVRYTLDFLRARARDPLKVDLEKEGIAAEASLAAPVTRPDEAYTEREKEESLERAIKKLGKEDRHFMELYYTRGLSPEEVSQVLGISVKTVYSRVNRLKEKLSRNMESAGRK